MPIVLEKVPVSDQVTAENFNRLQDNVSKALLQATTSDSLSPSPSSGIVTVSSSVNLRAYSVKGQDRLIVCNVFITDLTVSLPTPKEKRKLEVINAFGGQFVKVQRQDGQSFTLDQNVVRNATLTPGKIMVFIADGQNWVGYGIN